VRAVWATAHVALLLSWREGLPRTLVEAMACGRPVVATDVVGCRALVRDGVDGFLVPRDSVEATAQALRALYDEPHRRAAMGAAARQRFESGYSEDHVRRTVAALYVRLIAKNPDRARG
jgi:glycosyltransferase involved in cell wall biosynthesis